jgi:hypothetical protein
MSIYALGGPLYSPVRGTAGVTRRGDDNSGETDTLPARRGVVKAVEPPDTSRENPACPMTSKHPTRRLLTSCTACRRAITYDTPAVWQLGAVTGMVHADCATDPDAQPINLAAVTLPYPRVD